MQYTAQYTARRLKVKTVLARLISAGDHLKGEAVTSREPTCLRCESYARIVAQQRRQLSEQADEIEELNFAQVQARVWRRLVDKLIDRLLEERERYVRGD